jgi:hypothetical protein
MSKSTNALNRRPRSTRAAKTGPGIPDDKQPTVVSANEIARAREKLLGDHGAAESTKRERDRHRQPADGAA